MIIAPTIKEQIYQRSAHRGMSALKDCNPRTTPRGPTQGNKTMARLNKALLQSPVSQSPERANKIKNSKTSARNKPESRIRIYSCRHKIGI